MLLCFKLKNFIFQDYRALNFLKEYFFLQAQMLFIMKKKSRKARHDSYIDRQDKKKNHVIFSFFTGKFATKWNTLNNASWFVNETFCPISSSADAKFSSRADPSLSR